MCLVGYFGLSIGYHYGAGGLCGASVLALPVAAVVPPEGVKSLGKAGLFIGPGLRAKNPSHFQNTLPTVRQDTPASEIW